jgi:hypothetical protein
MPAASIRALHEDFLLGLQVQRDALLGIFMGMLPASPRVLDPGMDLLAQWVVARDGIGRRRRSKGNVPSLSSEHPIFMDQLRQRTNEYCGANQQGAQAGYQGLETGS